MTTVMYRGWIPTVGQRLSFSIVGASKHPTPAITSNVADDRCRRIISYQLRPSLLDSAIPFFKHDLARRFFALESEFRFICVARSGNDCSDLNQPIEGTVYVVRDTKTWISDVRSLVKPALNSLDNYDGQIPLDDYFDANIANTLALVSPHCIYEATFTLERSGLVTIHPYSEVAQEDPRTELEVLRKQLIEDRKLQDRICSQVFYFLKDICHVHQHHDPTTDTIVGLHAKLETESDLAWMNNTLRVLYSKILEFKRIRDDDIYAGALGVLAYVTAFTKIAESELSGEDFRKLATRNNENLKLSIQASQLDHQADMSRRARGSDIFRNTLFAVIGVLIALAGLGSLIGKENFHISLDSESTYIQSIANLIINHPVGFLLSTVVFVAAVLVYERVIPWKKWSWVRDLYRVGQTRPKNLSFLIWAVFAIIIGAGTYLLVNKTPGIYAYFGHSLPIDQSEDPNGAPGKPESDKSATSTNE